MAKERFTTQELEAFRERFRQKEPDPKYLVRKGKSIRDLVVATYPRIAELRGQGYTVEGLAQHFGTLGVAVTESTLRNYIGYARRQLAAQESAQQVRPRAVGKGGRAAALIPRGKPAARLAVGSGKQRD